MVFIVTLLHTYHVLVNLIPLRKNLKLYEVLLGEFFAATNYSNSRYSDRVVTAKLYLYLIARDEMTSVILWILP